MAIVLHIVSLGPTALLGGIVLATAKSPATLLLSELLAALARGLAVVRASFPSFTLPRICRLTSCSPARGWRSRSWRAPVVALDGGSEISLPWVRRRRPSVARSKLTSKGQTTIPLQVRERLGLRQGDAIDFVFQADGSIALRSATRDVRSLKGYLHRPGMRSISVEEMTMEVRRTAVKRYLRAADASSPGRPSVARRRRRRP
jgi:AbrB family looped-hinge helix DNA binding protein